jgi:hypothetical protein
MIATCKACNRKNQIPALAPGKVARCGHCRQPFSDRDMMEASIFANLGGANAPSSIQWVDDNGQVAHAIKNPNHDLRLTLVERDRASAWFRTRDGRFDVLGDDLDCTTAAARAAGAGPVWSWRPAKPTRAYSNDQHPFTSKAACLADLERHA